MNSGYFNTLFITLFYFITTLTTSAQSKDIVLDFQLDCREQWLRSPDTYTSGGTLAAFITTEDDCRASCTENTACVGVLIKNNASPIQCWIIKSASALAANSSRQGYVLYELQKRCNNAGVPSNQEICTDTWTRRSGQYRAGGTLVPSVTDQERCLQTCIANLDCVMCTVHTVGAFQCLLYLNETFRTAPVVYDTSYQEYELITRCATGQGRTTLFQGQGSCNTWLSLPNVNSQFATFQPGRGTLALCQQYCIDTPSCVAVDFDETGTDTAGCWVHTDPNDLLQTYDTPRVTQYRLQRGVCSTGTGPSTTQGNPGQCATWTRFTNTNSLNADFAPGRNTLEQCQAFCIGLQGCVAIDFDHTGLDTQGCWYHTNAADLNQVFDTLNVDQYRYSTQCTTGTATPVTGREPGECATWTRFSDTNSLNAQFAPGQNTVQMCQDFCISFGGCVAIDFDHTGNPATQGCWFHVSSSDLDQVFATLNVDQYRFSTVCATSGAPQVTGTAAPPCATWQVLLNTNSINANLFAQYNSVDSCRAYCVSQPTCVAVDFDHAGGDSQGCWVHTDPADLTAVFVAPNVDQHRLSRTCTSGPTTAAPPGTGEQCASFSAIPDSNSINAVRFTDYPTLAQCQAFCVSVPMCVAVDFDSTNNADSRGCWVHTNPDNIRIIYDAPGVTQYRLDRTCRSSSVSGGICNDWQSFPSRNSINGVPVSTITTLAGCQQQCIANLNCVAIEFDTATGTEAQCWLHLNASDLQDVYTAPDTVTQYRLTRQCVTTEAPSCVQFELIPFTLSANGLPYLDIDDPTQCQNLCAATPECVACDFDYSTSDNNGCWIHTNLDDLTPDNTFQANNVDQYRIDRSLCSNATTVTTTQMTGSTASTTTGTGTTVTVTGTSRTKTSATTTGTTTGPTTTAGCRYTWGSQNNTNIPGGIPTRDITVESCQQRCISRYPCFAIDIDRNADSIFCWIHVTQNPTQTFNNVTHMTLTRDPRCPETITTTSTTSTTTPTTTTGPRNCYFKILQNSNANGGTLLGKMSLDQCVQSCRNQYPYCVAVDHRTSDDSCYLQTSLSGRQWNTCCTRYEIYCTSSACNDSFALYTNRAPTSPGSPLTTATTLDACQQACWANTNCQAFAWGVASRFQPSEKCYLTIGTIGTVAYSADFNFYVREVCSSNQLFTTATTTPAPTPAPGACVLDIVFVVDISGSVAENQPPGVDNLALIRQFLRNIIQPPINVGTYLDRVGLVVFESSSRTLYTFSDPQNVDSFTYTAINGIPYPAGETNTPAGLDRAYNILFPSTRGSQPVVILITDGQTTQDFRVNLAPSIQRLVNAGTTRIAIGVTDAISMDDLRAYATNGDYVTVLQSFQQLESVQAFVINSILVQCNRPTIPNPGETTTTTPPQVETTTTTTTTTTTEPQLPPTARQVAFSVSSPSNQDSTGRVSLPTAISNFNNHYDTSNNLWNVQASGIYWVEACAGLQAGRTAELRVDGAGPTNIGVSWESTVHNGVDTACRAGLIRPDRGAQISLVLDSGSLYSSQPGFVTMFTGFSVTDTVTSEALSRVVYAVMATPPSTNGPVSLVPVIGPSDSSAFDGSSGTYRCQISGPHIVSASLGIAAGTQTIVHISNDALPVELTRNSGQYNGVTTITRTVVLDCSPGRTLHLEKLTGSLVSSSNGFNYTLTSLSVIPFQPRNLPNTVCWQAFKAYIVETDRGAPAADPFLFNNITLNLGGAYDGDNSIMVAPYSGYYFMSFSVGSSIQKPLVLSILRNEDILYRIEHQVTTLNQEDFYSHSVVALLNQGDEIRARGETGGSFFSGVVGYQAGFGGCLLYTV